MTTYKITAFCRKLGAIKTVRDELRSLGMILSSRDGEFRVSPRGFPEEGYYTDDLNDAYNTGLIMANDLHKAVAEIDMISWPKRLIDVQARNAHTERMIEEHGIDNIPSYMPKRLS